MKNFTILSGLLMICFLLSSQKNKIKDGKTSIFKFKNEQTNKYIAVYGTDVTEASYTRAYRDIKSVMDNMNSGLRRGLLNSAPKILVVKNEGELEENIDFFIGLLPVEAVFTDVGISNTKLEFMYLCVYYSLLTDSGLGSKFEKLKAAYAQAKENQIFVPGEAYKDGYMDDIHENASNQNALKYGSYLYNLYRLYFGNDRGAAGEFSITTKNQLKAQNKLGFEFMQQNFE